jgi:hypothetical protein
MPIIIESTTTTTTKTTTTTRSVKISADHLDGGYDLSSFDIGGHFNFDKNKVF